MAVQFPDHRPAPFLQSGGAERPLIIVATVNESKNVNTMKQEKKHSMELVEPDQDAGSLRNAQRTEPGEEIARPAYHESIDGHHGHAHLTRKERHMQRMSTTTGDDLPDMGETPRHTPGAETGQDVESSTGHTCHGNRDAGGTTGHEYPGHCEVLNESIGHTDIHNSEDSRGLTGHETGHRGQDEYTVRVRAGVPA